MIRSRHKLLAAALTAAVAVTVAPAAPAGAADYTTASVTDWKANAAPQGWSKSLNRVFYNSRGADGMFDAFSARPDGTNEQCITCAVPSLGTVGAGTHRGVSDVSPDGKWLLLDVERASHFGKVGASEAEPGKGAYSDVWLGSADGARAWPLTDIYAPGQTVIGTIWPRFDRTGSRLTWSELITPTFLGLGHWRLKVADIAWSGGVPRLANIRTLEPEADRFYEPYGFTPDNQHVVFASDLGMPNWWDSQIFSIRIDGAELKRLSPADAAPGFFSNYNEFAFFTPNDDRIIYGRTRLAARGGMDYWTMAPDGTNHRRLTFFNEWSGSMARGYTVVGGLAFDPNNPNRFIAGISPDMDATRLNAITVDLTPVAGGGLTAQYFADTTLTQPVVTRVENPSAGLRWTDAPAPGVPLSGYSARWTGTVTPARSGTYSYCITAEAGARLWVRGRKLADTWSGPSGRRQCATIRLRAARPVRLRLESWGSGPGAVQLTWIPPSARGTTTGVGTRPATRAAPIPTTLLAPGS